MLNAAGVSPEILTQYQLSNYFNPQSKGILTGGMASLNTEITGKVKKKRVKKERDPNAPKRPLTAFFLYSTYARPEVKKEMGDETSPVDVNNEILKRWKGMSNEEKEVFADLSPSLCKNDKANIL